MGFYVTEGLGGTVCECREKTHLSRRSLTAKAAPPSKNRVVGSRRFSTDRARLSSTQTLEPQREKQPTPTSTASGVRLYGYRYYSPELGRWLSRDPIGERGGHHLYVAFLNAPLILVDRNGLDNWHGPQNECSVVIIDLYPPVPAPPGPGPGDQWNPFGCRGRTGEEDYTEWFNQRFPNTVRGAKALLVQRIIDKACADMANQPTSLPDLTGPLDDVDIPGDMSRRLCCGDRPQNWWEDNVCLGNFEIKADNVSLAWSDPCCFSYSATVFVQEHTGADAPWAPGGECCWEDPLWFTGCFVSRDVRMAEWEVSGDACCDGDSSSE